MRYTSFLMCFHVHRGYLYNLANFAPQVGVFNWKSNHRFLLFPWILCYVRLNIERDVKLVIISDSQNNASHENYIQRSRWTEYSSD